MMPFKLICKNWVLLSGLLLLTNCGTSLLAFDDPTALGEVEAPKAPVKISEPTPLVIIEDQRDFLQIIEEMLVEWALDLKTAPPVFDGAWYILIRQIPKEFETKFVDTFYEMAVKHLSTKVLAYKECVSCKVLSKQLGAKTGNQGELFLTLDRESRRENFTHVLDISLDYLTGKIIMNGYWREIATNKIIASRSIVRDTVLSPYAKDALYQSEGPLKLFSNPYEAHMVSDFSLIYMLLPAAGKSLRCSGISFSWREKINKWVHDFGLFANLAVSLDPVFDPYWYSDTSTFSTWAELGLISSIYEFKGSSWGFNFVDFYPQLEFGSTASARYFQFNGGMRLTAVFWKMLELQLRFKYLMSKDALDSTGQVLTGKTVGGLSFGLGLGYRF